MEKTINIADFSSDEALLIKPQVNYHCKVCGEEYARPILAEIFSGSTVEAYYACIRCLSKVDEIENQQVPMEDSVEEEQTEEAPYNKSEKTEDVPSCSHHMGFLKKREKNSPIPEECLTCLKMIDCM